MNRFATRGLLTAFIFTSCLALTANVTLAKTVEGYLYTSLNGEKTNQVVSFDRYEDGTLGNQTAYPTDSLGGANLSAGGDAAGDFDSQGAMQIIGSHLLVVNAGGNTVTVFDLDRRNGRLTYKANVHSGGIRPVSMTVVKKAASDSDYWVVNGTIQMCKKAAREKVRSRCIRMPRFTPLVAAMR